MKKYFGLFICFVSSFLMASSNVAVKHLQSVNPVLLTCFRFLVMTLLASPIALVTSTVQVGISKKNYVLLLLRGIITSINIIIKYYALHILPLADVVMISSTSTIFTVFSARIFLKEQIVPADLLGVILIVVGMVCMAQPDFIFGTAYGCTYQHQEAPYALIALVVSSVLSSNVLVILRVLKDIHWSNICTSLGFVGFLITLSMTLIGQETCLPSSGIDRFLIILVGLLTFGGQLALILLAKIETASFAALLRKAMDVILAFIFQLAIFHVCTSLTLFYLEIYFKILSRSSHSFFQEIPNSLKIIGTLLIASAIFIASGKKLIHQLDKDHLLRRFSLIIFLYSLK